jgi:hypothetical protein
MVKEAIQLPDDSSVPKREALSSKTYSKEKKFTFGRDLSIESFDVTSRLEDELLAEHGLKRNELTEKGITITTEKTYTKESADEDAGNVIYVKVTIVIPNSAGSSATIKSAA